MNFLDEKQINLIPINVKQKRMGVFTYRKISTFLVKFRVRYRINDMGR